jgi:hypothetical protein
MDTNNTDKQIKSSFINKIGLTQEGLEKLIEKNPSLRGLLLGYMAEDKFEEMWLKRPEITECYKNDDHDRKGKGDRVIEYKGRRFVIEVKSLQTNTIMQTSDGFIGKSQVDASDRRVITLPDGSKVNTTCLQVGEFDVLAVNLFGFGEKWNFVFARNFDLPRSNFRKYTEYQKKFLLASLVPVELPTKFPFYDDLFMLLDEMIEEAK